MTSIQTWFITGATGGFGDAFARHALARGHNVVATARDPGKLAALVALAPERVQALALDVAAPGAAEIAVRAAVARFGGLDVVINNAGYAVLGAVEETPDDQLRAQMDTNFFGAAAVMRAVIPVLRTQASGAIVNISSLGGQLSMPGFGAYSASKFALEGLSEALAAEMAPFGVKVLIVEPGQFRTNLAAAGAMPQMPPLPGYESTVGPVRDFAHSMHGTQAGDPLKAAAAISQALRAEKTPLRLQLGADAVDMVRDHARALLAELEEWAPVARATAFD